MTLQAGSAASSYTLDISGVKQAVQEAKRQIDQLRQEASKPLPKLTTSTGGVTPQTTANTQKAAIAQQRLATEQQRTAKAANDASVSQQRLATEQQRTAQAAARAEKAQLQLAAAEKKAADQSKNGGLGPALPRTLDGLSGSAAQAALGFISLQAATKGLEFVKTAAEVSDARVSLDNLAKSANTTGNALLVSLRAAADGTIKDSTLIQAANTGILLTQGKIVKDLPQLVTIARASAKATGQDIGFIFDSLVKGIARGSPKIIDNAGITLDAAKAFEDYAKSIGKSANQLTKDEQQQATLNAVLKDGSDIVKQVGLDSNTAAVNIAQAETAVQNLGETLAAKIGPFVGKAAGGIANLLNTGEISPGTTSEGGATQGKLIRNAQDYQAYAASINRTNQQIQDSFQGDPVAGIIAKQRFGLEALTPVQFAYAQNLIRTGTATTTAFQQAQQYSSVLGEISDTIKAASTGDDELRNSLTALTPEIARVATGTDTEKSAVMDLIAARGQGLITDLEFIEQLGKLIDQHERAAQAAAQEERENRNLTRSFTEAKPPVVELQTALADQAVEAERAKTQSQQLKDVQDALANIGASVKAGLITSAQGAAILANALQLPIDKARELINLQAQMAGRQAVIDRELTRAQVGGIGKKDVDSFGTPSDQQKADAQQFIQAENQATQAKLQAAKEYASQKKAIDDAQFQYDLSNAKNNAEQIAIYKRKLAQTTDKAEQLRLRTEINRLQKEGKGTDSKGLGALDQDSIKLAGDAQQQLDRVNQLLAQGNLSTHQRNQLLIEQKRLQEEVTKEQEKSNRAQLDVAIATIEDRKSRREEAREITALERALSRNNLSDDRRQTLQDELDLLRLNQQRRTNQLNDTIAAAGGKIASVPNSPQATTVPTAVNSQGVPIAPVTTAPVSPQGQPQSAGIPSGPLTITLQIDGRNFAYAVASDLQELLINKPIRLQAARGG